VLGSVDISSKPDKSRGKTDKIHEVFCPFIKPREDPAKLLEFSDEAFDKMALFINMLILFSYDSFVEESRVVR